uniref:Uncharacterized protein n=1 Tax=Fagus sylvatica TaxID=28930 RepID=A0A2N9GRE3_FAGSY
MESAIVSHLIDNIFSVLATEASLLWGVHDVVDDIKDELKSMRSFLVDADKKGASSEGEKTWVAKVRDLVYDVEDVIDKFMYHIHGQRIGGQFDMFLHHTIYIPRSLWVRHQIATKLQKINKKIKIISEVNQRYGVDRIESTNSKDNHKWVVRRGESSLFLIEDELVGIENKRQPIMEWLMDRKPQQTVISIVGMGGSGKTTLVANTYNNDAVKRHFDCYAWITVSQAYNIEELLMSMLMKFYESRKEANSEDLGSMDYRLLVKMLVNYLQKKKYLLVIDDVWDTNILDEIKVNLAFIILNCWKRERHGNSFARKHSQLEAVHQILTSLAQELVGKCQGLPLAIAALGSLLYSKHISQWKEIYNSLNWSLSNNPRLQVVKTILLLSFNDLPYRLKHCFLYCSLFPEDHVIRRRKIIMLWMAEGFVEQVKGSTPEEVAESYLVQLIFRSMLQVLERNESGRPKRCKMHDLMRELALSISEKEKFGVVHDGGEEIKECKARRISIQKTDRELKSFMRMSNLRSFLVFNKSLKTLPSRNKMLRVLDLEDAPINELPDELFNLFNLRYLSFRGTLIKELPNSIGRLLNLQTLDIKNTQIKVLPHGIGKLKNLRHLTMFGYTGNWNDFKRSSGMQAPSNICKLTNLQCLSTIEVKDNLITQIRSMTQLTSISISNVKATDEIDLCESIQNLRLLRTLFIMVTNEEETLRMDALLSPPPNLRRLHLVGKLEKIPQWFSSLQSLTHLELHWSRLEEDPLPHIAALPLLGRLTLTNAYVANQLCFNTRFPKFIELEIRNFSMLNEIIIEKGVMPNLRSLWIDKCMELKTVPKGIEHLNLQELILRSVSVALKNSIQEEGSVDFSKVQHIPKIHLS